MKFLQNTPIAVLESEYDGSYQPSITENFSSEFEVIPFVYAYNEKTKRLVLIWSLVITNAVGEIIQNLKIEFDYIVEFEGKTDRDLSDLRIFLSELCQIISVVYEGGTTNLPVRFKDIQQNYNSNADSEMIIKLLYND